MEWVGAAAAAAGAVVVAVVVGAASLPLLLSLSVLFVGSIRLDASDAPAGVLLLSVFDVANMLAAVLSPSSPVV